MGTDITYTAWAEAHTTLLNKVIEHDDVADRIKNIFGEYNEKKSKIIVYVLLIAVLAYLAHTLYYAYNTGSRSGRVIDAETGKPIEGAVVNYTCTTVAFMSGGEGGRGRAAFYETVTDKEGKYYVPNQWIKRKIVFFETLEPDGVVVYKDGYAAYETYNNEGKTFGHPKRKQKYCKKNNLVKLPRWQEGESHYRHIQWIATGLNYGRGEEMRKELEEEERRADEEGISF